MRNPFPLFKSSKSTGSCYMHIYSYIQLPYTLYKRKAMLENIDIYSPILFNIIRVIVDALYKVSVFMKFNILSNTNEWNFNKYQVRFHIMHYLILR